MGPRRSHRSSRDTPAEAVHRKLYVIDGDTIHVRKARVRRLRTLGDVPQLSPQGGARAKSYQSPYAWTALAQSRVAIEVIVAGLATRAFQASQQASTMAV